MDLRSEHDYTIVEGSPKLIPSTPSAPDFYRKAFEAGRVYERANPRRPASEEELTKLYARAAGPVIAARRRRTAKEMAGWEKKRAAERKTFEREAKKAGVSYDEYMEAYRAKKREEIAASQELPNRA